MTLKIRYEYDLSSNFIKVCSIFFSFQPQILPQQGTSSDKPLVSIRIKQSSLIITDRHPNPLFSVCIISPNAERKIMQTWVRSFLVAGKLSGVILHVLNRHAALLKHGGSNIKNNAACFSFNNSACFTCIYPLVKHFPPYFLLTRNNQKHHNKYF